ncbi:uncharacterized protein LOC143424259 [Xylocopa sonorina]|uniref:uncharacterized protein LOC143424259 n=1 Tax=Xylocopa sonorina TaxID=1818115 RepID=UPI00403B2294
MNKIRTAPLKSLATAAFYGSIGVLGTYMFTTILIEKRLRRTVTYKRALELFHNKENAVKYLGEPVKEGRIKVISIDDTSRKLSVNLKGSNTKGTLDCEYNIEPDHKTTIRKLEIKYDDLPDKTFVIHEV